MSSNGRAFGVMYVKFRPHLLMFVIQLLLSFLYFLVEASLSKGMDSHVFVTYRHVVGGIAVLPFAYVRERYIPYMCVMCFGFLYMLLPSKVCKNNVRCIVYTAYKYFIPLQQLASYVSALGARLVTLYVDSKNICSHLTFSSSSVTYHSYLTSFLLCRKLWPKLTMTMLIELFFLSLFGYCSIVTSFHRNTQFRSNQFRKKLTFIFVFLHCEKTGPVLP